MLLMYCIKNSQAPSSGHAVAVTKHPAALMIPSNLNLNTVSGFIATFP